MAAPPKTVFMYDDQKFIRVVDQNLKIITHFNKKNLTVKQVDNGQLSLTNDTNTGFYKYADVGYPDSTNVGGLVKTLIRWINSSASSNDQWDLSKADVYWSMTDPGNTSQDITYVNSASFVDATNMNRFTLGNDWGAYYVAQSRKYIKYRRGQDYLALIDGCFSDTTGPGSSVNMRSRFGLFEWPNSAAVGTVTYVEGGVTKNYPTPGTAGVYFEYILGETGIGQVSVTLVTFNSAYVNTDSSFTQNQWNIDKLDGNGPSGINMSDWRNKYLTFVVEMKCRVGVTFKVGIMHDSRPVFVHEFVNVGAHEPSLPVRAELSSNRVTGRPLYGGNMQFGSMIVYSRNEKIANDLQTFSATNAAPLALTKDTSVMTADPNYIRTLMVLRLKRDRSREEFKLRKLQLVNTGQGIARWDLVYLPPILPNPDTFTWKSSPQSVVEMSETTSYTSGWRVLASGFINADTVESIDLDDKINQILADRRGFPDHISLRARVLSGTCNLCASMHWQE